MYRAAVVALSLLVLLSEAHGQARERFAVKTPANLNSQAGQKDVLERLAGSWILETKVLGDGFLGSSFPGPNTPATEVKRDGDKLTLSTRLQTGQSSHGAPIFEDFTFVFERATLTDYSLSIESRSWLSLKQLRLSPAEDGTLKGETTIAFRNSKAPLVVVIEIAQNGGHVWDLTLRQDDGKPLRYFKLAFKPVQG
ncbi:MAG TPA: hypothetical protein VFZ40_06625 [Pyrinomonadaceae bacterium]